MNNHNNIKRHFLNYFHYFLINIFLSNLTYLSFKKL